MLLIVVLVIGAAVIGFSCRAAVALGYSGVLGLGVALALLIVAVAAAPSHWRELIAASETFDRALTAARDVGLTGLLFIAGLRVSFDRLLKTPRAAASVAAMGLALAAAGAATLSLSGLAFQTSGVVAGAAAASSLWLPGELSPETRERQPHAHQLSTSAAALLTGAIMLVVHLLSSLREVSGRGAPESAYLTIAAYELVKLAVFFGFACYIAIKFLERASRSRARTSDLRSASGYLLVAVLLFVLAVGVIGPLGGLAWSFLAGSLLARTEIGQPVVRSYRPAASAVFLSLAFLPMFVAPHGRSITRLPLLLSVIASLLVIKFTASWVAARVGGLSGRDSRAMAACSLAPGEIAVALLAFASTRWEIRAPEYFAVLLFSVAAMIAAPMLGHFEARGETRREERAPGRRVKFAVVIAAATALSVQGSVCAQSPEQKKPDDPVSRAMKSIEASIGERAEAAEAVLAASKLVNQSQAARKQGDKKLARKVLGDAEAITQASEKFSRSALIDELLRLVAEERAALDPPTRHGTDQVSPETSLAVAAPSSTRARFEQYRDSFARILEEERVPVGLLGVAFVESGFNPMALSPKGARGIWQLMPATAVRYGLMVQPGTDHRTHLERSTRAAARYLRDLYTQFGDWKLALAAYNAGEDRIQRIIDRTGIRDFDAMARRGYLPAETRRYVPAVLAAWARLATTKPLAAANARPRAQPRGGAVEALAKPEGSEPKR